MYPLNKIVNFLNKKYSIQNAEEWDNCGLQNSSNDNTNISNIVIALDLTTSSLEYAISTNAQLIITHHPLNFYNDELKEISESPYKANIFKKLKNNNIHHYVLHTNFDNHKNGMIYAFQREFQFKNIKLLSNKYGFIVTYKNKKKIKEIIDEFKKYLNWNQFKVSKNFSNIFVNKICIIPGSGSLESILLAKKQGAEVIFTSDIKWSQWITIYEQDVMVIELLHSTENVFINEIYNLIIKNFKKLNVFKSENEVFFKSV